MVASHGIESKERLIAEEVAKIKQRQGPDLHVWGSGNHKDSSRSAVHGERLVLTDDPAWGGPWGDLSLQLTAFFTSAAILASSAAVNFVSAKAVGHMAPSSRVAASLKPNVAYLALNLCALWKKQTTLPSLA